MDRHRRRRLAVDRRQPPDPRAAPQRPDQDPAVQQPDLRVDQGAGVADLGGGQGHEVDAVRRRGPSVQPGVSGARGRGELRRAHDRPRQAPPDRCAPRCGRARGRVARRDLPELPGVQRRRVLGADREGDEGREPDPARRRGADPLRRGERARRLAGPRWRPRDRGRGRRRRGRADRARPDAPRSGPRLLTGPPGRQPDGADADRDLPRRAAPRLRARWRRAVDPGDGGRARRPAARRRQLDRRLTATCITRHFAWDGPGGAGWGGARRPQVRGWSRRSGCAPRVELRRSGPRRGARYARYVNVELLWWKGCPSTERALETVREALTELGLEATEVRTREVRTDDEATELGFLGSPTILIDGVDLVPAADDEPIGLSCRVYRRRDGRISPLPDPDDLREALQRAAERAEVTR